MKTLFILFFAMSSAFAQDCKVDGISDSPQSYTCQLRVGVKVQKLKLRCVEGTYQLEWLEKTHPVTVAYHEEVEEGSNPLVFVAEGLSLVTVGHKLHTSGSLTVNGKELKGFCFK